MKKFLIILVVIVAIIGVGFLTYEGNQKYNKKISDIKEKIYVAIEGSGEIAVINATTNKVFKRIDLSEAKNETIVDYMPHNIEVSPNNQSVWVTASAVEKKDRKMSVKIIPEVYADSETLKTAGVEDQVIVIDPLSDTIIRRINLGTDLHLSHVSLTPDSSYAIVASQEKGILYKIDTTTFEIKEEVSTKKGGEPHGLRIAPDGLTAYIAMLGGKSLGILDIASFELEDILLNGAAVQTGITPDGKYALASVYEAKSLAVLNIKTSELNYIDLPKEAKGPVQLYPTPDSHYVYIADQGYYFDQPVGNIIYKIDLETLKVIQTIKGGSAPHGVVVSMDGKFVYVTNLLSDDVSVIDTLLEKEIAKINVGKMPNGISLWYGEK